MAKANTPNTPTIPTTPATDAPTAPVEAPSSVARVEAPKGSTITLESGTTVTLDADKRAAIARVLAMPQCRVRPERAPAFLSQFAGISASDARAAIAAYKSELLAPRA